MPACCATQRGMPARMVRQPRRRLRVARPPVLGLHTTDQLLPVSHLLAVERRAACPGGGAGERRLCSRGRRPP